MPQERRPSALFTGKTIGAIEQAIDEPLKANRDLDETPLEMSRNTIDYTAAHDGLSNRGITSPRLTVGEQVGDSHGQIMIGVQETGTRRDDAMPIVIGIVGKRHVKR